MDPEMLGIANAITDMRQSQVQMAVQTELLKTVMDNQSQAVTELLQSSSGIVPMNPNLGNKLDMYV